MKEILAAARMRFAALSTRDARRLRRLLAPGFAYTNAAGKVFDRDSYILTYALDESVSWASQKFSEVCVAFSGETALLTAIIHDVARFGEYRLDARFRTTQIYRRSANGWIYLAGHTSNLE